VRISGLVVSYGTGKLTRPTAAVIAARGMVAASSKDVFSGIWNVVLAQAMAYSANEP
jgi:hypothetical protein